MSEGNPPTDRQMSYACADCLGRGVITLTTVGRHTTVYRLKKKVACAAKGCTNEATYALYSYPDKV